MHKEEETNRPEKKEQKSEATKSEHTTKQSCMNRTTKQPLNFLFSEAELVFSFTRPTLKGEAGHPLFGFQFCHNIHQAMCKKTFRGKGVPRKSAEIIRIAKTNEGSTTPEAKLSRRKQGF